MWQIFVLSAVLLLVGSSAQEPPKAVWPVQWSASFNESTKILYRLETSGTYWYDALANAGVVHRDNGKGDRYCGSIHPFSNTPCRHVVTQGKRYLVFPELGECCMCCTAEQGCGLLSTGWLDDATYQGVVDMNGVKAYKYEKKGLQSNFYYATADERQIPLELDQMPNDLMTFDPDSFNPSPIDPELLMVPADCKPKCPLTSVCTLLQLQPGARTAEQ